jgi:hypothetical protein
MCSGIAIPKTEIPDVLMDRYRLRSRITSRGGDQELRFLVGDKPRVLPTWVNNQLIVLPWGNQNTRSRLPRTGFLTEESLESGQLEWMKPEHAIIPAAAGIDNGRWYQIQDGITGVIVSDEINRMHVYMLTEPASHYYRIMTGSDRMPVLVRQQL